MLDVFGPGSLVTPQVWHTDSSTETRHAVALLPTTTLELSADAFERHLTASLPLALAVVAWDGGRHAALLDRLAMLSLRDPLRRGGDNPPLPAEQIFRPGESPAAAPP